MIHTSFPHRQQVQSYINTCGIVDPSARQQLHDFSDGIYDMGLWNSMVCWPMRSSQNFGKGTVVQSLGGLGNYNGAMSNGPTWGTAGISFISASLQSINLGTFSSTNEVTFGGAWTSSDVNPSVGVFLASANAPLSTGILLCRYDPGNNDLIDVPADHRMSCSLSSGWEMMTASRSVVAGTISVVRNYGNVVGNFSTQTLVSDNTFYAGGIPTYDAWHLTGILSVCWRIQTSLTDTQIIRLNTLYKSTLGTGLGLP